MATDFRVLDAARSVRDDINRLIDTSPRPLVDAAQLRDAAGGICANIREAYGRRPGAERNQFFRVSRSCSEETDEHLHGNYMSRRIAARTYWQLHNRLAVIVKMLNRLMGD